ncbi:MAG: ParB/RepB/Spo0J family partition protein [Planctomycetaceae bacterium]
MDELTPHFQELPDATTGVPNIRRRLGRGLSSLLGTGEGPALLDESDLDQNPPGEFSLLDEQQLSQNPWQPRKEFDPAALEELVDSIRQHGVLQPLLVRAVDGGFQVVAGERRLIAARKVGLSKVPCRIVQLDDKAVCEVAIIENVQRTDLHDLEKAQAFQEYLDRFGGTIEELARKLGKDRSTISNCLRLLELPDFVKVALQQGKISAGHGRSLLPLEHEADQIALCQRIQSEHLSVRQTEEEVRLRQSLADSSTIPFESPGSRSAGGPGHGGNHVLDLANQLRDLVGARVEIRLRGKDSGRVIIHFSSNDEFERIVGFLRKAS